MNVSPAASFLPKRSQGKLFMSIFRTPVSRLSFAAPADSMAQLSAAFRAIQRYRRSAAAAGAFALLFGLAYLAQQLDLSWGNLSTNNHAIILRSIIRIHSSGTLPSAASARSPPLAGQQASADALKQSSSGSEAATSWRPPGFENWVAFAKERGCVLEPYDQIRRDLAPFRDGITREMLEKAKTLSSTLAFKVSYGSLSTDSYTQSSYADGMAASYTGVIGLFAMHLPDMEFVINILDEPRVLPRTDSLAVAYAGPQCSNASENFLEFRHLHGFVVSPGYGVHGLPSKDLVPILSQTKIEGCYADIRMPNWFSLGALLTEMQMSSLLPWNQRISKLYFRGSATGGHYVRGVAYILFHRQRLVELAKHSELMDCQFTAFLQCDPAVCRIMVEEYGVAPRVPDLDNFKYKFVMSVDGNTLLGRLPKFFSSGSLIFRGEIFSHWFDERIKPWEHFIPVKLDYSDLEGKIEWALKHDEEAAAIAAAGQMVALTQFRDADFACYLFRLLLEYGTLLKDV